MARLNYSSVKGKLITFLAEDKLLLNGFLAEKLRSGNCIIFVHGMTGNFYGGALSKALAEQAARSGYSTFCINTRGHDLESGGKILARRQKRVRIGTKLERFEDSVYDIGGAIKAMKRLGYRNFVLAGHSTGCQKALYYASKRKDRSVKALLLYAPDDDYNLNRKKLGKKWAGIVRLAKRMSSSGRKNVEIPITKFSAQRFLSVADLKRAESRLFNYDGPLREFGEVRIPVYVAFGKKDEGAVKPVSKYIEILKKRSNSKSFGYIIISNARHSFSGYEKIAARAAVDWIKRL